MEMAGSSTSSAHSAQRRAKLALALLLGINLFNYIDRYVLAAVEPEIRQHFFGTASSAAMVKTGSLATAFLLSYMLAAPIFGRMADRMSRWLLVGVSVVLWSLASGASGLALTFSMLLLTRAFVGIGEAGYGPSAPTIIADLFPVQRRGAVLAWFYMAIPVGSALGYGIGGFIAQHWGWRWAFMAVVPPGLLLGALALLMRDPPRGAADRVRTDHYKPKWADYALLLKIPSYLLDTAGMVALTFAIGGISFWMPAYLVYRKAGSLGDVNMIFGVITAVAGVVATLLGGMTGDALRRRFSGAYFVVSAGGILISCPLVLLMLITPFPWAWMVIFGAVFFLFFNTGPSNAILANVTPPAIRASAFALNILLIHALGDAISPTLLGGIIGDSDGGTHWNVAFVIVAIVMAGAGALWLWGARFLARDTAAAPLMLSPPAE